VLPHEPGSSQKIKRLYAQRMQIEETGTDAVYVAALARALRG
jgi:hypothetical protein